MKKRTIAVASVAGLAAFAKVAISAEDPATAVAERREMMKETVRPNAKLGGDMVKGKVPFDAAKAEEAMAAISEVPDKYVTLFPEGSESRVHRSRQLPWFRDAPDRG
jgi:cytochrome c556